MPTEHQTTIRNLISEMQAALPRSFEEQAAMCRTTTDMIDLNQRVLAENAARGRARQRGGLALPNIDPNPLLLIASRAIDSAARHDSMIEMLNRPLVSRDAFLASGGWCAPNLNPAYDWTHPMPTTEATTEATTHPHPAVYSVPIRAHLREIAGATIEEVWPGSRILDPFAGQGLIHETLADIVMETVGVELEPEWAACHPQTQVGDARSLPFLDDSFDAVMTSPCYGNRMADAYDGRDGSARRTYRLSLGRDLTPGSGAGMQWGDDYRTLHLLALGEMYRVVRPGGFVVVNISNHIRGGEIQHVVEWWVQVMTGHGNILHEVRRISTQRYGFGRNGQVRVGAEHIIVVRLPS